MDKVNKLDEKIIEQNLQKIKCFLNKEYLGTIKDDYSVLPFSLYNQLDNVKKIKPYNNIGCLHIKLWVKNKEEQLIDKFKNIFTSFEHTGKTVALAINRRHDSIDFYFFVKNENTKDKIEIIEFRNLLEAAIKGNFPGSQVIPEDIYIEGDQLNPLFKQLFEEQSKASDSSISVVNAIATEKSEKFKSQGIEKLLDGIIPAQNESYTILFIAESLKQNQISSIKKGFEDLGTAITPYIQYQTSSARNTNTSETSNQSLSHSHGINESITKSFGCGINESVSSGGKIGVPFVAEGDVHVTIGSTQNWSKSKSKGFSDTDTTATSTGKILSEGISDSQNLTHVSYELKDISKQLEQEIQLMDVGKAMGLWKSAAYIIAPTKEESLNIANFLKSLIQGEKSSIEPSFVQVWTKQLDNKILKDGYEENNYKEILNYISNITHPVFFNKGDFVEATKKDAIIKDIAQTTLTNYVTTKELAAQMCFPQKAVPGLPVVECSAFGREVVTIPTEESKDTVPKNSIDLGKIYHMHNREEKEVLLDADSLTSHTFITGSTGAGKSNTVYQLLSKATEKDKFSDVHFLVIEPAKGEYKNIFGELGANIYGTNPKFTNLLRLNPFSFDSNKILVHEHIDRLISIFNVCWPMYAAMPAVLKEAVEKSYKDVGWNLEDPFVGNEYDSNFFPTFADVARNIKEIIDSSEYDTDNKGAYKGSLLTRLKSLSNGINGMIFSSNETGDEKLFEENTIIDLSRVGSAETKSLIMGILILKLQEHRIASEKMNSSLSHITVLEEAHNLLKRTSTDMSSESGNLAGKSVEMISNAIAEMRTYGEAFIIADQAPGLLDMAAIRNTNTKIIMRLPDLSDRELVGKAANLSDEQITELAKLPRGVAAVYQNEWVQPVLCKVEKFKSEEKQYKKPETSKNFTEDLKKRGEIVETLLQKKTVTLQELNQVNISSSLKVAILNYQKTFQEYPVTIGKICAGLLPNTSNKMEELLAVKVNVNEWVDHLFNTLTVYFKEISQNELIGQVIQSIIENSMYQDIAKRQVLLNEFKNLYKKEI